MNNWLELGINVFLLLFVVLTNTITWNTALKNRNKIAELKRRSITFWEEEKNRGEIKFYEEKQRKLNLFMIINLIVLIYFIVR